MVVSLIWETTVLFMKIHMKDGITLNAQAIMIRNYITSISITRKNIAEIKLKSRDKRMQRGSRPMNIIKEGRSVRRLQNLNDQHVVDNFESVCYL